MKLFGFFLVIITLTTCSRKQDKILPTKRVLTESVYSSVTVQPDSLYKAYAVVAGILDSILIEEGDAVKKHQTILQIINSTPKLNTQNAKFALALAKENYNGNAAILSGIADEISAAKLKFKNDSINYFRQKNLWEKNIGSKVQYDTKKLNYEMATNNLKLLQSKYDITENELLTTVKLAQNNYQASLLATKDYAIKSKINGKVYAIYKEPGEIVTTMEPLASIGSGSEFVIEMLVDEVDIVKIRKEQRIILTLEAYNSEVFNGNVTKIYPKKDERNQTFKVEAVFENPPEVLYPGLSGEANIVIAIKNNTLTIPKAYLIDNNKVITADGLVAIETGLQNMEYIEILSGISPDTFIYKPEE